MCRFLGTHYLVPCSNTNHDSVSEITSKPHSRTNQNLPISHIPSAITSRVRNTAPASNGKHSGKSMIGNNTSRALLQTAIADNRVPNAENPIALRSTTAPKGSDKERSGTLNNKLCTESTSTSTQKRNNKLLKNFDTYNNEGSTGVMSTPGSADDSCARKNG